jgi:hypothetical protein
MSRIYDIGVGVLSGCLTSALLFLLYKIKVYGIEPWLENRLYKGVILEGSWAGRRIAGFQGKGDSAKVEHSLDIHMELKQSGYKVTGLFNAESTITRPGKEPDKYTNFYKISGHINDNYLVIEYCPVSRKRTGLGAFVLQVKNGGKVMVGSISFVEETDMEVTTLQGAILNRVDSE